MDKTTQETINSLNNYIKSLEQRQSLSPENLDKFMDILMKLDRIRDINIINKDGIVINSHIDLLLIWVNDYLKRYEIEAEGLSNMTLKEYKEYIKQRDKK